MPPVPYKIPDSQAVLAVRKRTFHVSSDNAMLDSGGGFTVTCWVRDEMKVVYMDVHTGRDEGPDYTVPPGVNATPEEQALAVAYNTALTLITMAHETAEKAHYIKQGTRVRAVRGRKAPKGEYEACHEPREGQYGPYVSLRGADGKYYNYVSPAALEVIPDYAEAFGAQFPADGDSASFAAKVAEAGFTPTAWGILADWLEETCTEVTLRNHQPVPAPLFAAALRRITSGSGAPKFSTYYAERLNMCRR